jgi:transposase
MQVAEPSIALPPFAIPLVDVLRRNAALSSAAEPNLSEMPVDELRDAIRENRVTFPAQVPVFSKHDRSDLQRQLVQLYFLFGWSGPRIGTRYGLRRSRIQQILNAWKRRAVELGYIQSVPSVQVFTQPAKGRPIRVVLSPVLKGSAAPVVECVAPESGSAHVSSPKKSPRPRAKFNISEIVAVLQRLEAGRTAVELANELGISAYTVRLWKEQHEIHLLRHQNAQLKARLARLNAVEKTLIDVITRSDSATHPSFMPFSQVSSHTETDYRESL